MSDKISPPRPIDQAAAVSVCLSTLTKRADFIAASRAKRKGMSGVHLQARKRRDDEPEPEIIRVGYTCSKKVGNAVARNRAKRRLREIAREILPIHGRVGWDYVLVGRHGLTASLPFKTLKSELIRALKVVHPKG